MIACILVIVLLLIVIIRCVMVGIRSGSNMGSLVCFGVAAFLTFQTFENIGMCIGITPVIGITLPFFSYGGSSLFTTFAALGMVSGIHFRPRPKRNSIYYRAPAGFPGNLRGCFLRAYRKHPAEWTGAFRKT